MGNLTMYLCVLLYSFMIVCTMSIGKSDPSSSNAAKKLCFHAFGAEERGTDVATYDYADYAESLLGYQSMILLPDKVDVRKGLGYAKYFKRFGERVVYYKLDTFKKENNETELLPGSSFPHEAKRLGCDFVYILKSGERNSVPRYPDAFNASVMNMGVHAVFTWDPHDALIPYAGISPDVTKGAVNRTVVPHIVRPPAAEYAKVESLRKELNIKHRSFVVCRHGGMGSFDVPFVYATVFQLLRRFPEGKLHFVFLGTRAFKDGPQSSDKHTYIHHLPSNSDMEYKERFFKTCDVMLHARRTGESFGLAVAEFSVRNKPVVTYRGKSQEHIRILGSKGYPFHGDMELMNILGQLVEKGVNKSQDYNAYRDYAPEIVMKQFKSAFLDFFHL